MPGKKSTYSNWTISFPRTWNIEQGTNTQTKCETTKKVTGEALERFQFRWLKIKVIYAAISISITLFEIAYFPTIQNKTPTKAPLSWKNHYWYILKASYPRLWLKWLQKLINKWWKICWFNFIEGNCYFFRFIWPCSSKIVRNELLMCFHLSGPKWIPPYHLLWVFMGKIIRFTDSRQTA